MQDSDFGFLCLNLDGVFRIQIQKNLLLFDNEME